MFTEVKLTPEQTTMMEIARVGFMNACPFLCYYFYAELKEQPTRDIPTAATDGRRIAYNPDYLLTLKPAERLFVLAHEVYHVISGHPTRFRHYGRENQVRGLPWSQELMNIAADLVINAELVDQNIGQCNPAWLYDPSKGKAGELPEDVYERLFKNAKGASPSASGGGRATGEQPGTYGQGSGLKGGKPDAQAQANSGRFDEVLDPQTDSVSGKEDLPSEAEFKEAVARAAAAAKAMGNMPAGFQRIVDEILEPQVNWREHIRMLVTGKVGARHETWERPNRRRLVLNPMVFMPGRRGYGARDVAVAVDTSGSIGDKEIAAFRAEIGGILQDVKPKNVYVIWCDAAVHGVDIVSSIDEARALTPKGGGGTDFRPVFDWLAQNQVRPECLVYLTDMMGSFPDEAPGYPTVWCATTDIVGPFGEMVRIKL